MHTKQIMYVRMKGQKLLHSKNSYLELSLCHSISAHVGCIWLHLTALERCWYKTCPNNLMGPIARHGQVQPKCININVMHPGTEYAITATTE